MNTVYLPLDTRPCNLKFPQQLSSIANISLITPPQEILGNFFTPANREALLQWLFSQDKIEHLIVMLDLLAFGGLVASRKFNLSFDDAAEKINKIKNLRINFSDPKFSAGNVLTRLAENISAGVRQRNHKINLLSLNLCAENLFDFLIISQEDCKPTGIHLEEQKILRTFIKEKDLWSRSIILAGCDEVAMMLLARCLGEVFDYHPKIYTFYSFSSSHLLENIIPLYEDRPLYQSVKDHIFAVGALETSSDDKADLMLMINLPHEPIDIFLEEKADFSKNLPSFDFMKRLQIYLNEEREILLADCAYTNGADDYFLSRLSQEINLLKLTSFAAWNTSSNTLGTVLAHGVIYSLAKQFKIFQRENHHKFLLSRFIDDWLYQSRVRLKLKNMLIKIGEDFSLPLQEKALKIAREVLALEMRQEAEKLFGSGLNFKVDFPWGRIFEVDISIE